MLAYGGIQRWWDTGVVQQTRVQVKSLLEQCCSSGCKHGPLQRLAAGWQLSIPPAWPPPTCCSILPACAKLAEAGDSEVREAGQAALVAFAVRAGSMGILDKVGGWVGWAFTRAEEGLQVRSADSM